MVLKRSMSGLELELQLLDGKGKIANMASEFIKKVKKENKKIDIVHEQTEHVFELKSLPKVRLKDSLPRLFDDLEIVLSESEKVSLKIFGLGVYPGHFEIKQVKKKRYDLQARIFNKRLNPCSGFHYHYALPRNVFDYKKKFLKQFFSSKTQKTFIDSFNMLVAVDPAVSTLMQSSPFFNRKFVAKDSRMLIIRDPFELNYKNGFFQNIPEFAELPQYIFTMSDLRERLLKMDSKFKKLIQKTPFKSEVKKKNLLDFVWTAVKVNKLGTLEHRGMDMNHPKYFAGMAVLLKSVQRLIQQDFYHVEISDIAIKEPFKVEGTTIFIPPQNHVKNFLQIASAYKGFEDKSVYNYVKRFFSFARKHTNKDYLKLLDPLKNLIARKKTVSDVLIEKVKRKGHSIDALVPQSVCEEIALSHAEQFEKEVFRTKKLIPS